MNLEDVSAVVAELVRRIEGRKLLHWLPYGHPDTLCPADGNPGGVVWRQKAKKGEWYPWSNKPWQYDFLQCEKRQKLLMAGNRVGKSDVGAFETALHVTGLYPDWYDGVRHEGDIQVWCSTISAEFSRDVQQEKLFGSSDKCSRLFGTGLIPSECIDPKSVKLRQAGIVNVIEQCEVQREDGGVCLLQFKSYEQGWRKFGGRNVHHHWLDEPPDETNSKENGIWAEAVARCVAVDGTISLTMTPKLGSQHIINHFQTSDHAAVFMASQHDCPHISDKARQQFFDSLPVHMRDCCVYGLPQMGTGMVWEVREDDIICEPFAIPDHFYVIAGVDFGYNHPGAAAWLAHDRNQDIIYVYDAYRKAKEEAVYHAHAVKARGDWIPVAWPHDGMEMKAGELVADTFRRHGCKMLSVSARYKDDRGGGQDPEIAVREIGERMATGRWRVFASVSPWREEFRTFHRDDNGKLVSRNDDVLKASMYAYMMRRYARQKPSGMMVARPSTYCRPMM